MKTLLIYMADNMHSHDMIIHKQATLSDSYPHIDEYFQDIINNYRMHFNGKKTSKVQVLRIDVDDATNLPTIVSSEAWVHPIKEKIVINKPAKKAPVKKYATAQAEVSANTQVQAALASLASSHQSIMDDAEAPPPITQPINPMPWQWTAVGAF